MASSFIPRIKGFTPDSAGTEGTGLAILQGNFGADPRGSVTIGGNPCLVSSYVSIGLWICEIPGGSSEDVEVLVQNYGHISAAYSQFSYDPPKVDSIEPQFLRIDNPLEFDKMHFKINGTNFGSSSVVKMVTIAGAECTFQPTPSNESPHRFINCTIIRDGEGWNEEFLQVGLLDVIVEVDGQTDDTMKVCHEVGSLPGSGKCLCPAGQEYQYQNGACIDCSGNQYSDGSECRSCPLGSSIAEGATTATDSDSCVCGANAVMNSNSDRCECLAGYGGDATVAGTGCGACGVSAYKGGVANTACQQCPLGATISDGILNATDFDSCTCPLHSTLNSDMGRCECLAGYGGDATKPQVGCSVCGTKAFKGAVGNTQCTSCPLGSSIAEGATTATDSDSCVCGANAVMNSNSDRCECLAGYGGDATVAGTGCGACGVSAYKGGVANTACQQCPLGATISDGILNATDFDSCTCPLHSTLNSDMGRCECLAGYGGDATKPQVGCSVCGTKAFKGAVGNTQCTSCPLGSSIAGGVITATDSGSCSCNSVGTVAITDATNTTVSCQCAPGFFGNTVANTCEYCPVGGYKDMAGDASACISCTDKMGEGATTLQQGSLSEQDCFCGSSYYMYDGICMECEMGASCPGGDVSSMVALPGYWRSEPTSTSFFSCESPNGYTLW